jgi:predicted nucleic acid-binding protein
VIVLDSSAAVDYLVDHRRQGAWVGSHLLEDDDLHAPHVLDIEVVGALRRLVAAREISRARAERALVFLADLDVARYPHLPLIARMWSLRRNLSSSDAAFVALAEELGARLVTTDGRLGRAPGHRAEILAFPG